MNTRCKFQYKSGLYFLNFSQNVNLKTVFTDGFESMSTWDKTNNSFGHSLTALDTAKKKSGNYSGRIDDNYPRQWSKYVYSDTWTPINNSQDTYYTVSGWVYVEDVTTNGSLPNLAKLWIVTRKQGERGYPTGHISTSSTKEGTWEYLSKTVLVPADVKEINVRIENARLGKVWFDDVKIVKGNTSQTVIVEESNYYPFGLEHKGYNNVVSSNGNSVAQKFGYNGKELNEELGLQWHDFGARNYDASLGRWMNIDPLAEKMRRHSPYNYAFNSPLMFVDPDGLYPILITTRSYAPFKSFGPFFARYHGDDRGHSSDLNASYRTSVGINYDTETHDRSFDKGNSLSYKIGSKPEDGTYSKTNVKDRSSENSLDVHSYGNNADQPGSWDIDQFTKLEVNIDGDIKSDHILNVAGTISGDDFPNQESLITDSAGNTLWLGNFATSGGKATGPTMDLARKNEGDVHINVNISINVNADGVFQSVIQGDKTISIQDWNKQFK